MLDFISDTASQKEETEKLTIQLEKL